ncbi:GNAT superfamily N-acetyltransferase [Nocardioides aromaticivorans]|uniref:GNAT superfamily N-acetyltransferase n=1 Tax=Nocardioides aromaticivorans TaxID=200618 RepID=A0A7Y9ZJ65_9ACTN|nr:GNAT family N-acetyltransferase [Nocardioides aromaticivorans]NYI46494.1 GNAT superfamily N-acetyltransferase [Nocardioides aromaticivorans]
MSDARRPPEDGHPSGRHLLGPHVIGQRIVVRRLLRGQTGPTGGPGFTDLLGTCLAWGDGRCVVQPESGEPVTIAIGDIVSGKPVPPRPSTRLRVSTRDAEARTGALWPDLERIPLGEWELRCQPDPVTTLRKRANSCLAIGDPGRPVAEAAQEVVAFYAARGRDPLAQLEAGSPVEDELRALGWHDLGYGESELRLAAVSRVRRTLGRQGKAVELTAVDGRAVASVGTGCDPLAEAQARLDGDWLGIYGLTVDPGHRRRGLASAVLAELLDWGAEQGALTAWLHVETANPGGLAFWDALGFAPHHTCRYYVPPAGAALA